MKVELKDHVCIVTREPNDPKINGRHHGESLLWYKIKAVFDQSYYDFGQQLLDKIDPDRETYELTEAVGGGRHFDVGMKWDELYEPKLYKLIEEAETQPPFVGKEAKE